MRVEGDLVVIAGSVMTKQSQDSIQAAWDCFVACFAKLFAMTFLLFLLFPLKSFATYGSTCNPLPLIYGLSELQNNMIYGFVKAQIESTDPTIIPANKGCQVYDNTITICVFNMTKSAAGQSPSCDLITFNLGDTKQIFSSTSFTFAAPSSLTSLQLTSQRNNGQICLMMPTSKGNAPVVCKGAPTNNAGTVVQNCKLSPSCYDPTQNQSKALFNFSGKAYLCVRSSLDQIFYGSETCVNQDSSDTLVDTANIVMVTNPYASFQIALRQSVFMALVLYLMVFGMKMMLEPDEMNLNKYAMIVIQVVLVLYFSIGLGSMNFIGAVGANFNDGMTQLVLPFLLSLSTTLTDIVFSAGGGQGLCYFDSASYPKGFSFYALWDSIDCRITYYFGGSILTVLDSVIQNTTGNVTNTANAYSNLTNSSNPYSYSVVQVTQTGINSIKHFLSDTTQMLAFFTVFVPIILGGGFTIVVSMIAFGIMFFGLALNLLTTCMVCLICIYFMTYLAPLFVPMVLFERTKGYFDGWWKLLLSFALRPVIVAGFVALTVTIFDSTFYGNCIFSTKSLNLGDLGEVQVYTPQAPSVNPQQCTSSIGMKLKDIYAGRGLYTINLVLFQLSIWTDVLDFMGDMLKMCIVGYLMYYFMGNVEALAAELSGSQISISSMVVSANSFIKAGAKVFGKGMKAGAQKVGRGAASGGKSVGRGAAGGIEKIASKFKK